MSVAILNSVSHGFSLLRVNYYTFGTFLGTLDVSIRDIERDSKDTSEPTPVAAAEYTKLYFTQPITMQFAKDSKTGPYSLSGSVQTVFSGVYPGFDIIYLFKTSEDLTIPGEAAELFDSVTIKHKDETRVENIEYTSAFNLQLVHGAAVTESAPFVFSIHRIAAGTIVIVEAGCCLFPRLCVGH